MKSEINYNGETHGFGYQGVNKRGLYLFLLVILGLILFSVSVFASDETYLVSGKLPMPNTDSISATSGGCFIIKAGVNATLVYVNQSGNANRAYLTISPANTSVIGSYVNNGTGGSFFYFNYNLTSGLNYCVKFDSSGGGFARYYNVSSVYPYSTTLMNLTSGVYNNNQDLNIWASIYNMYLVNQSKSGLPVITFINQTPSDITTTNAIGTPTIIYYNYSTLNTSNAKLEYGHVGMNEYINGTLQSTYSNKTSENISSGIVKFILGDNDIYGYTGNYDSNLMENTPHGILTITGIQDVLKTEIMNLSNTLNYNILEIYVNSTNNINVYYCNSSYTTGNPNTNNNCALVQSGTYAGFNHSVNNSRHNVFSMPVISRNIGTVNMTSTGYIVIRPLVLQSVNFGYINGSVRNGMFQTSGNGGISYTTDNTKIPDIHIHQYLGSGTGNENLSYRALDSNGNYSVYQVDNIGLTLLPPSSPQVNNNISNIFYCGEYFNLTWSGSSAQVGSRIVSYNISLVDEKFNLVKNYGLNTSGSNVLQVRINNSVDGFYYFRVEAKDNNSLSSFGYSNIFVISGFTGEPCNDVCYRNNLSGLFGNIQNFSVVVGDLSNWDVSCVSDMTYMFYGSDFNQNLSGWNVSSLRYANNMFSGSLNTSNYDALLNGWINSVGFLNVRFGVGDTKYSNVSFLDHENFVNNYNWWITDGGFLEGDCVESWYKLNSVCDFNNLTMITWMDLNDCGTYYHFPSSNGSSVVCEKSDYNNYTYVKQNLSEGLVFLILWVVLLIGGFVACVKFGEQFGLIWAILGLLVIGFGLFLKYMYFINATGVNVLSSWVFSGILLFVGVCMMFYGIYKTMRM